MGRRAGGNAWSHESPRLRAKAVTHGNEEQHDRGKLQQEHQGIGFSQVGEGIIHHAARRLDAQVVGEPAQRHESGNADDGGGLCGFLRNNGVKPIGNGVCNGENHQVAPAVGRIGKAVHGA